MKPPTFVIIAAAAAALLLADAAPAASRHLRPSGRDNNRDEEAVTLQTGTSRTVNSTSGNVRRTLRPNPRPSTRTTTSTNTHTTTSVTHPTVTRRPSPRETTTTEHRSVTSTSGNVHRSTGSTSPSTETRRSEAPPSTGTVRHTATVRRPTTGWRTETSRRTETDDQPSGTFRRTDAVHDTRDTATSTSSRRVTTYTSGSTSRTRTWTSSSWRDRTRDRDDGANEHVVGRTDGTSHDRSDHTVYYTSGNVTRVVPGGHGGYEDYRHEFDGHRGDHGWASSLAFNYRNGRNFFRINSGPHAPYWRDGRWHPCPVGRPHRPGCGRVLYYGFWIDVHDVYYVQHRVPPWATPGFWDQYVVVTDEVPEVGPIYDYNVAQPTVADEGEFVRKELVRDVVRQVELMLSSAETRRVETLEAEGVLDDLLDTDDQQAAFSYEFDRRRGLLVLTAPSERIAMIQTIIGDQRTFDAVLEPDSKGNVASVVPLVSPLYFAQDPAAAGRLAADNFYALRTMLLESAPRYGGSRGAACWLNTAYGTATVVDQEENLERAFTFIEMRPFAPRDMLRQ